jgi:ferritin-like metal-binding protein YciE
MHDPAVHPKSTLSQSVTMASLQSLQDLYLEQLRDLYSAENQIIEALPKMAAAASHAELKLAFQTHLEQTRAQVQRIERICEGLGESPRGETCDGMKGLLKEGEKTMKARADSDVLDAALIAAAQRVEHYEIAGYGCAKTYARLLGRQQDVQLLQQTEDEEGQTDKLLTRLAEQTINLDALAHG